MYYMDCRILRVLITSSIGVIFFQKEPSVEAGELPAVFPQWLSYCIFKEANIETPHRGFYNTRGYIGDCSRGYYGGC